MEHGMVAGNKAGGATEQPPAAAVRMEVAAVVGATGCRWEAGVAAVGCSQRYMAGPQEEGLMAAGLMAGGEQVRQVQVVFDRLAGVAARAVTVAVVVDVSELFLALQVAVGQAKTADTVV